LVEVPLTQQCVAELKEARAQALRTMVYPTSDYIFPARGKASHLRQFNESKLTLSHSGNCGRHTHHTLGIIAGVDDLTLDVLEGRSLLKAGAGAGRGYIDRIDGPKIRAAQQIINDRIDTLLTGNLM
jgi:hypothetical protein